ncbi:MAG: chitobiase/beta-hexosaminidase C-terminal domain-containing protein [Chitinophagaceae bacterium]
MRRTSTVTFNVCFGLNCLLLFLLLMEKRIRIPAWLQVGGRMHPLILHFPVVLLVLSVLWLLVIERKDNTGQYKKIGDGLLLFTALTTVLTALTGLFLSKEAGYEAGAVQWHKWSGVALSITAALLYAYREWIRRQKLLRVPATVFILLLVIITGHQGASLTHGSDFLLAPVMPEKKTPPVLLEDAMVFRDMVKPVLDNKCMSCHNSKKAKGELVMETEAMLLKGGKSGKLWDPAQPDLGLLLQRIHLPEAAKKHMPPSGKPQLSADEEAILYAWIRSGADFRLKVTSLPEKDTLRQLAASLFNTIETDEYDFQEADEKTVEKLNTNYRIVRPLAQGSPALGAEFYGASFYQPAQLEELLKVKEQIVSLNMNHMPVKDNELKTIARFTNLRKLNLSFTAITGSSVNELKALKELKQLALSGTPVTAQSVLPLAEIKSLTHLYLWSTSVKEKELKGLLAANKSLRIETGSGSDTGVLRLPPPAVENEEVIITAPVPLKLKHYVNGVIIRYTTDGTDPDSLHSPVYDKNVQLTGNVTIRAKAFKQGWLSSDITESNFYSAKVKADSVINLLPPDDQYKSSDRKILADLEKDPGTNFRSGKWVGYRQNSMSTEFIFREPQTVSYVTLSMLIDINSYIMPPAAIEIWGDTGDGRFRKMAAETPAQPAAIKPAYLKGYEIKLPPAKLKAVKVVVQPVSKLPPWHPGKGDKGWVFLDEVFFN